MTRWTIAADTRRRIREGAFTGFCYKDRLLQKPQRNRRDRPVHPAVDWERTEVRNLGSRRLTRVAVTCPKCSVLRWVAPGPLAARLRDGRTFTGECLGCSKNARKREWTVLGPGRKLDPVKGYIRLTREAIDLTELWLYEAMRGRVPYLMEHRLVVARSLGRPLRSNELVDHMDGVKTNNDIANLRVYRRGFNEPGETTGYGTYYHEWQMALARIAELESALSPR